MLCCWQVSWFNELHMKFKISLEKSRPSVSCTGQSIAKPFQDESVIIPSPPVFGTKG